MSLYIPIILGTARAGRRSEVVAQNVLEFARGLDIKTELIDVRNFPQTFTQEPTEKIKEWQDKAQLADGFIIVVPEYNHGYPGELKIFLDNVYTELNYKPVGFVGVSTGPLGAARGIEQLRLVTVAFHMTPTRSAVYVGNIIDNLDKDGQLTNKEEINKKLKLLFDEVVWYAGVLQEPRLSLKKDK